MNVTAVQTEFVEVIIPMPQRNKWDRGYATAHPSPKFVKIKVRNTVC